MSEDWQVGDVALCVDDSSPDPLLWPSLGKLRAGAKYTVVEVKWNDGSDCAISPLGIDVPQLDLRLLEIKNPCHDQGVYAACRFIKQPPLVKEDEVIRELELTK